MPLSYCLHIALHLKVANIIKAKRVMASIAKSKNIDLEKLSIERYYKDPAIHIVGFRLPFELDDERLLPWFVLNEIQFISHGWHVTTSFGKDGIDFFDGVSNGHFTHPALSFVTFNFEKETSESE